MKWAGLLAVLCVLFGGIWGLLDYAEEVSIRHDLEQLMVGALTSQGFTKEQVQCIIESEEWEALIDDVMDSDTTLASGNPAIRENLEARMQACLE